jgi:heat shock protein HtpX
MLKTKMFLLVALLFGILYGIITGVAVWIGIGGVLFYIILACAFLGIQYMVSPYILGWMMKIEWISEGQAPWLHKTVAELADRAHLPKPKVGISRLAIPNAFAFGRNNKDGRVCVTQGILELLSDDELKAVLGHEMSHIKHRDMMVITLISAIPLITYWIARHTILSGIVADDDEGGRIAVIIGLGALVLYFITNLLVLYGSRIREYYADKGSVELGNEPHHLATALYKLVYSNAQFKGRPELKQLEVAKAFFVNDPSRAWTEIRELSQVDRDMSGIIDSYELMELRSETIKLRWADKIMEINSTHPNMLKRIKYLSSLKA